MLVAVVHHKVMKRLRPGKTLETPFCQHRHVSYDEIRNGFVMFNKNKSFRVIQRGVFNQIFGLCLVIEIYIQSIIAFKLELEGKI